MIVITIMGLAMAVVTPRFGGALEGAKVRAALRDTSDLLRTAHAQAAVKRENWRVRVDQEQGLLSLLGPQTQSEEGEESLVEAKLVTLPKSLKITDVEIGKSVKQTSGKQKKAEHDDIVFYPFGNSTGCKIDFRDGREREYTIEVNPFTSRVQIINEESAKN